MNLIKDKDKDNEIKRKESDECWIERGFGKTIKTKKRKRYWWTPL